MLSRNINLIKAVLGLVKFKIKHPNTRWVRPRKIGTFYSQDGQDLYLASLLFPAISKNCSTTHWVVDVGCNHPINFSNSLFFERYLGCKVLGIDPISELGALWEKQRPKAIFRSCAIGEVDGSISVNIPIGENADNMFAFVDNGVNKRPGTKFESRRVKLCKLSNIFTENEITEVLLLSIDVEGFELNVLKSIDFEKALIRCIVVENNSTSWYGSDDIREFLLDRNYEFYARIGHLDDVYIHGSVRRGV